MVNLFSFPFIFRTLRSFSKNILSEFCEISKNAFLYRTPPVAASDSELTDVEYSSPKLFCKKLF